MAAKVEREVAGASITSLNLHHESTFVKRGTIRFCRVAVRRYLFLFFAGAAVAQPFSGFAATVNLQIHATLAGSINPVCVRAIIKQSDGSYISGEWGSDSWPTVNFRGKAISLTNSVTVQSGTTTITVGKGPDYLPQTITTNLTGNGQTYTINFTLQPQLNLLGRGWFGGDAHVHFFHGEGEISRTPQEVFTMAAAGGLNSLSLTEEHYGATTLTRQQMLDVWKSFDNSECKIWLGIEEPKNQWGHHASVLYEPWPIRSAIPYSQGVHDVHEQGGVSYPVHPERWYPLRSYQGVYSHFPLNNQFKNFPLESLTGHLLDAWSGVSDEANNSTTLTSYLKLLSVGYKIPLLSDSDFAFDRINNGAHSLGFWMNYFQLEGDPVSRASICNAIRKGRAMCTTGPLVLFSIDGAISGDTLPADGATRTARIEASYRFNPWTLSYSNFAGTQPCRISQIDLLRNGQVVKSWTPNAPTALLEYPIAETTNNSSYMVRVLGNDGLWMAGYASPIFFENAIRPRQPPVFKPLIQGRLYDAVNGSVVTGLVSCVRYGETEWSIPTDNQGRFRVRAPIDADLVASDNRGRTFTQNIDKFEPAYAFLTYLPENYSANKGPSVDAFSNLVQQMTWEFPMGLQLAASYVRTNLSADLPVTNLSLVSAPAPFPGKTSAEIVMLLVDKTQVQAGDTINYAAIFRKPNGQTPAEELSIVWRGWDPVYPRIYTKYQTVFQYNNGTSGHINLGNGFYMRGGSVVVPNWVTNDTSTTGAIEMLVTVRSSGISESAHLSFRLGPTKRELLVSSTSDGFPATWGQIGIGPCNFFRDNFTVRYADYRETTLRLNLSGQQITINPKNDTAHVADADNAIFYENFYYDGQCEPQYRNIPFRDPVRTQPADPDFSSVPIQNPPDTTPPNVVLMEPFLGEQITNNPVRFYYFLDDAGLSGASNATLLVDGLPAVIAATNNPLRLNLSAGVHTWQIRGFDNAGNSALSPIRSFTLINGSTNAPVTLHSLGFTPPNQFRFHFGSTPGQNYSMQFTTNFSGWTTIAVTNAAGSEVEFIDSNAINSARFYRALLGP